MLSFVTPLWLLGLALLAPIRWLHRGGRHRRAVPVSRLDLWRGAESSSPAAGQRRPPDPAWRRRALLTALLCIALAGPQWPQQRTVVTLWVDDSLSMLTREARGTRLALAVAQARSRLAELGHADVEVRALGDPWHSLGTLSDATVATVVAGAGLHAPGAPPAALLRGDRLHWLVTDGAHGALLEWPGGRQADRIVQVAGVTRNVGLERLSARRNPDDPEKIDLLLKMSNGGTSAETREVIFVSDTGDLAGSVHRLDPGTSALVTASIPASARVGARLRPGDALAEDDEIALDLAPLNRHRVAIDPKCPKALVAAVLAHPALAVAPATAADAGALLDCGTPHAPNDVATIRVFADGATTRPPGPALWSSSVPESRRVRLDRDRLQLAARLQARPTDAVLLAVGDEPVIVGRAGAAKRIETSLDFESMALARGPEIPLLVNLMFERLLGGPLLDAIAATDRGTGAAHIVPAKRIGTDGDAGAAPGVPGGAQMLRDGAPPVLVAALLVLLWEIVALAGQWVRLSAHAPAESE